jgi:iron complex transport system ATP-binding protein
VSLLVARGIAGGYGGGDVVGGVDLALAAGRCVAVLGPNGAGKSTLLRLLAGILPARAGTVELLGRPLAAWRRREVARVIGFVPQLLPLTFPIRVRELVEQGRAPHLGPWRPPAAADHAAVARALTLVDLEDCAGRPVQELSGGERQRALLARALASEPRVLLLDEPAAALDVAHQLELVTIVRRLLANGVAVAVVVHDWNLALRLADDLVVLDRGRVHTAGTPADVLGSDVFGDVFGVAVEVVTGAAGGPVVVPRERRRAASDLLLP